jgi:D-alanyl-D-alanine carboxypeptidase
MRVIEPRKKHSNGRNARKTKKYSLLMFIVSIGLLAAYVLINQKNITNTENNQTEIVFAEENIIEPLSEVELDIIKPIVEFSGNEFRLLYDNSTLPGTTKINTPPQISENVIADARIREIAERRGYKIRVVANIELSSVGGIELQPSIIKPWLNMKNAASKDGINIVLTSGYRSVEEQKQLFVNRLVSSGVNLNDVANGIADEKINKVLLETALPGYSKHHSGYTIDLLCPGWAFENFKNSNCNEWLTRNTYENARKFGFIPSYPKDADLQGPDPEAWEYVYVGVESLNP